MGFCHLFVPFHLVNVGKIPDISLNSVTIMQQLGKHYDHQLNSSAKPL